jgi:hypothetical protein
MATIAQQTLLFYNQADGCWVCQKEVSMQRPAPLVRVGRIVFGLTLMLILLASPNVSHFSPVISTPQVVAPAQSTHLTIDGNNVQLSNDAPPAPRAAGRYQHYGFYLSPVYAYANPFQQISVAYQATTPNDAQTLIDVRASSDGTTWSAWETGLSAGATAQFQTSARYAQYRVTLLANTESPVVRAVQLTPRTSHETVVYANEQAYAPTYRVRGTRQGMVGGRTASGHVIQPRDRFVSLPSWRSLSNAKNPEYWVRITYNGRTTKVPVLDVGPWNVSDNYWDVERQKWKDLPRGYPQDHAAYFDGYNNGYADKGRVSFPTSVDVGDGAWLDDLGIVGDQAWVEVTFLWLGRDPMDDNRLPKAEPNATTLARGDQGFEAGAKRTWYEKWGACSYSGNALWTYTVTNPNATENWARWRPTLNAGFYDVQVFVPSCAVKRTNTASARYVIKHVEGVSEVEVNQVANAGKWVSLGKFGFAEGAVGVVEVTDLAGDQGQVLWIDAVKWVKQ